MIIRPVGQGDVPGICDLADDIFSPAEIQALRETLADYFSGSRELGHQCCVAADGCAVLGFFYAAPAVATDRTWFLYWIAVAQHARREGVGKQLLAHVEQSIRQTGGRMIVVETSSLDRYRSARELYLRMGYFREATVHDFQADGDHLAIYVKRLSGEESR